MDYDYLFGIFKLFSSQTGGVIVGVPVSSAIDRGFYIRSSQTKGYKIGICCYQ
jgi:hypothetical protein